MRRSGKVSGGKQNQALWGGEYGQDKKTDGIQGNAELVLAQTCYHSKRGPVYFYSACMLFLYIYGFRNAYQNEIYTTFDSLSQNIESQLEKNLQQIYELSRSISYSTTIQTYLLSPDKIEAIRAELHRRILCLST